MNKFNLRLVLLIFICHSLSFAQITVIPASNGTNLSQSSPNVSEGWAALEDITIIEEETDDIAGGQTDVSLILSSPFNWEFKDGVGSLTVEFGDLDDVGTSISITPTEITIIFSILEGNLGTNEFDIIFIEGIRVRPIDPNLAPSLGQILRTGGTAAILGGAVSDSLNYGDLSLDVNDPLPVELSVFTASVKNNSVYLNWVTVVEINNYGFEIERSIDEIRWEKLSFIPGYGNSNTPQSYSFTDYNLSPAGKYFYRLKQLNSDGTFEYSKVVEANIEVLSSFDLSQNYPNPFNPETKIKFVFNQNTIVSLKLFDLPGNEVADLFNETVEAGKIYEITFNATDLSSGIYYYRLTGDSKTVTKKMMVLK